MTGVPGRPGLRAAGSSTELALLHDLAAISDPAVTESAVTVSAATVVDNARRDRDLYARIEQLRRLGWHCSFAWLRQSRQALRSLVPGPTTQLAPAAAKREQAERLVAEATRAEWTLFEEARWIKATAEHQAFARQPARPEPPPRRRDGRAAWCLERDEDGLQASAPNARPGIRACAGRRAPRAKVSASA